MHSSSSNLAWFKSELCEVFRATHLGALSRFLSVAGKQGEDYSTFLSQTQYTQYLIEIFLPAHSKSFMKPALTSNLAALFEKTDHNKI